MLQYESTVIRAVQEVEDALVSSRTYREEHRQRMLQADAARNAARLSRARYDDGVTSYLEVLDVERSLFAAELGASEALERYFGSIVQIYKALGGGWRDPADESRSSDRAGAEGDERDMASASGAIVRCSSSDHEQEGS